MRLKTGCSEKGMVMKMRNIKAVFLKQVKDIFKNKTILVQFVMFPMLVIIMENVVVI